MTAGFFDSGFTPDPAHPGFFAPTGSSGTSDPGDAAGWAGAGFPPHVGRTVNLGGFQFDNPALSGVSGVRVRGLRLQGWDGSPASTRELQQRRRGPGAWASAHPQLGVRPLTITGTLEGVSPAAVEDALRRIRTAANLQDAVLTVDGDGVGVRFCRVARSGEVLVESTLRQTRKAFSVAVTAADPRKFGATLGRDTTLPQSTGGLAFPHTFPEVWPAVTVSGQIGLVNTGDITGPVVARVTGPLPGFRITHTAVDPATELQRTRLFEMSLRLAVGDWVDVWMESETVLALGQESRASWITSRGWSGFDPGVNTWSFGSSGPADQGATLAIAATPAWQ